MIKTKKKEEKKEEPAFPIRRLKSFQEATAWLEARYNESRNQGDDSHRRLAVERTAEDGNHFGP